MTITTKRPHTLALKRLARPCFWIFAAAALSLVGQNAVAAEYLVLAAAGRAKAEAMLADDSFVGLSKVYYWSELEPTLGQYDFSAIEADLALVRKYKKQLVIMVRDKSFKNNPILPVPAELADYVVGGPSTGYLAMRWDDRVNVAFRDLILALGDRFNADPNFMAFKTSETAPGTKLGGADVQKKYISNLSLVIETMARAFPDKDTYFYMNWGPGGRKAINAWGNTALANGVGLGGPDIHPDVAMPSYSFIRKVNGRVKIMMDVQYSNYSHGTPEELKAFGEDQLNATFLAWLPYKGVDLPTLLAK